MTKRKAEIGPADGGSPMISEKEDLRWALRAAREETRHGHKSKDLQVRMIEMATGPARFWK